MNIPATLAYTAEHEWLQKINDTEAIVGITDFAQGELGDIVFVEIETLGETMEAGAIFGTVEAVKTVSDLFIPVAGKIIEINEKLKDTPELINNDPYGDGWLVKIALTDASDTNSLLSAEAYQALIGG